MSDDNARLPDALAELAADFAALGAGDQLQLLIELGAELPPLPGHIAAHRELMEPVQECQSPLVLKVEVTPAALDPTRAVHVHIDAPAEAPTTRGFAAVLHQGLDGLPAADLLAVPDDVALRLGLRAVVSPLRLRGMNAMVFRIKRQVRRAIEAPDPTPEPEVTQP